MSHYRENSITETCESQENAADHNRGIDVVCIHIPVQQGRHQAGDRADRNGRLERKRGGVLMGQKFYNEADVQG